MPHAEEVFDMERPETDRVLKQAMDHINAGDLLQGRKLLEQVLEQNPQNDQAWVWLSACVQDVHQRRICLQQALRANPDNQAALDGIKVLDGELFQAQELGSSLIESRLAAIGMGDDEPTAPPPPTHERATDKEPQESDELMPFESPAAESPSTRKSGSRLRLYILLLLVLVLATSACALAGYFVVLPQVGFSF
jgi:hypothetical protein